MLIVVLVHNHILNMSQLFYILTFSYTLQLSGCVVSIFYFYRYSYILALLFLVSYSSLVVLCLFSMMVKNALTFSNSASSCLQFSFSCLFKA
jgi:hypothetical protein